MSNELMLPENLPEYVPLLSDLQEIFPKLPPADKVKDFTLKVGVQAVAQTKDFTDPFASAMMISQRVVKTIAYIEFTKINDNGKQVWIYEGKVKYK